MSPNISDELADFAAFYDATLPQVYRYVAYRVADTATAEDLTSAIFENALRAWNRRRKPEALMPWIFRIARNTVFSHYRQNGRHEALPLEAAEALPGDAGDPEQRRLEAEQRRRARQALHTLNRREQDLIALKFGSGMTNRELAPLLGLSESNVAVLLHRALRKVQAALAENR
ncbi:MAG: sigma-70 family RNA polymerase sigma factor [Anaerolineae bacterium]|jgi:RNA polymerase sigma-70 factor (ECF subfamily)|nr:sigma-70 family RNA polymerase sigma factor [Anaerolineae bacterium]